MIGPLPPPVGGMASVIENLERGLAGRVSLRILNNAKTTAVDRPLWQGIAAQTRLLGQLAYCCLVWRPRIVHIHTCSWATFWRNAIDVVLARLLGRKVILHIHGAAFHQFLAGLTPPLAGLARGIFACSHRVLVLGENWRQLLARWTNPERLRVLSNGVPLAPYHPPATDGPFRIICLGNYEQRKGQSDLLRAVARLRGDARPVALALLGAAAEPDYHEHLQQLRIELGLSAAVSIPGPVVGAHKQDALDAAHCLCLPSYDEGLPMAMLEAMAAGRPVVITAVGAVPEVIVDGEEGLLFQPGDIDTLSAHLESLRADPDRAAAIGQAGRERLRRDLSLERSVEQLLVIYQTLGARPQGEPGDPFRPG